MQACGVSITRLLRPVVALAVVAGAATCYTLVVVLPEANQRFRDIVFQTIAAGTENDVKARVFYLGLPNMALYVNEVDLLGTGWSGVFLADTRDAEAPQTYIADEGAHRPRPGEPAGRHRADLGGRARRRPVRALNLQRQPVRRDRAGPRVRRRLSRKHPAAPREREDHCRAAGGRGVAGVAGTPGSQPDHGDPQEVLLPGRVLRVRPHQPPAGRHQPQGRQARERRAWHRRHLRVLRPHDRCHGAGEERPRVAALGHVDLQHRAGRRGCAAARLARPFRGGSHPARPVPASVGVLPRRRPPSPFLRCCRPTRKRDAG